MKVGCFSETSVTVYQSTRRHISEVLILHFNIGRGQLKCDGTHAETRFRLSEKRTSPFKSAGVSIQSVTGSRGVHISGSNAGYTMFRGSVKGTGYPLHSPVSPSPPVRHRVPSHFKLESTVHSGTSVFCTITL